MRKVIGIVAVISFVALWNSGAGAQNALVKGTFNFAATGTGVVGTATSGSCQSTGTVPTLLKGTIVFDGRGNINSQLSLVYVGIGSTSCPFYSYTSGTYSVMNHGDKTFEANGTLTTQGASPYAPCDSGGLKLVEMPFMLVEQKPRSLSLPAAPGADRLTLKVLLLVAILAWPQSQISVTFRISQQSGCPMTYSFMLWINHLYPVTSAAPFRHRCSRNYENYVRGAPDKVMISATRV